jgi:hypothetical protein
MGHFLHFGVGQNHLPEPWQNLNASHDIRKPLRFGLESATAVIAEHVIEHVPFLQGYHFLMNVHGVLEREGTLRLSFPDVARLLHHVGTHTELSTRALNYASALEQIPGGVYRPSLPGPANAKARAGIAWMLQGWGHQAAWTANTAAGALLAVGFSRVISCAYGYGGLGEFDGHHREVGVEVARLETTVLEAIK